MNNQIGTDRKESAGRNSARALADLDGISVSFEGRKVLSDLHLRICCEDCLAVMGPSGTGKSTLLKVLAGLTEAQGKYSVTESVSMVFDDDGLYPFLSCLDNIELGIPWNILPKAQRESEAKFWADEFSCQKFLHQKAGTLSNGQRKRCALARAMMKRPQLLLLDETFHALDASLKQELAAKLTALQKKMGFAIVFATHLEEEAKLLDARILWMDDLKGHEKTPDPKI